MDDMQKKEEIERVKTGIRGLDELIEGGFPKNSSILITGSAGTGKTLSTLEFIYHGAKEFNENGVYVTIEERADDLRRDALRIGIDFSLLEKSKKVSFLKIPVNVADYDIYNAIVNKIKKIKAKRLVIDSITALSINSPMYTLPVQHKEKEITFDQHTNIKKLHLGDRSKQFIYIFMSMIKNLDITTLFIGDASKNYNFYSRDTVSESICDGLIMLMQGPLGSSERSLEIIKMRSTNHRHNVIPTRITDSGIEVMHKHVR